MDRNVLLVNGGVPSSWSLSARRAWIEIIKIRFLFRLPKSLSARRAWIEIVDPDADALTDDGRSPQGERG